jgi:hypothetical protein
MSPKDYILLAAALKQAIVDARNNGREMLGARNAAARIASALESANPAFNRERFETACGLTSGEGL